MKIGLPKLRLSRKLLLVTLGITVLLGGTGVTALYFDGNALMLEGGESAIGSECTDVQTMVVKTPSNHLWLRRFIRMENASGPDRVRTALRISGLLAKKHAVDLIHVSVLDAHGPTLRSQMRARAIGAEVLIALKPENLPEMKSPAMASYYEGPVSDEGRYYGDRVIVDIDEIGAMMTAMRTIEEKPDCAAPAGVTDAAEKNDHGKTKESEAAPANHGAGPEEEKGNKPEDHGERPAKESVDEAAHGEQPAKEESFLNSMLSMVGLGEEETAATAHPPTVDESHAVAEGETEGHGDKAAAEHRAPAAESDGHGTGDKPADASAKAHEEETPGGSEVKAADHGEKPAAAPDHAGEDEKAMAEGHQANEKAVAPAKDGGKAETHDTSAPAKEGTAVPVKAEDHAQPKKAKADEHAEAYMPVGD